MTKREMVDAIYRLDSKLETILNAVEAHNRRIRELKISASKAENLTERNETFDNLIAYRTKLIAGGFTPEEAFDIVSRAIDSRMI